MCKFNWLLKCASCCLNNPYTFLLMDWIAVFLSIHGICPKITYILYQNAYIA